MLFRNGQVVGFEGADVCLDGFPNVPKRRFLGFALGHAAGQTGALGDHQAVFPSIDQDLSHALIVSDFENKSEVQVSKQQSGKTLSLAPAKRGDSTLDLSPRFSNDRDRLNLMENRPDRRRWAGHQSSKRVHEGEPRRCAAWSPHRYAEAGEAR